MKTSISFIKSNYDLKTTIKKINETDCDYLHVDLMDGKFVQNKNFSFSEIQGLLKNNSKPLDIHLMVKNPEKQVNNYALLNTEYLIFHFEAVNNPQKMIELIQNVGIKVGMSIKPQTTVKQIIDYLPLLDQVLVMSVNPGKGGQLFQENALRKIEKLAQLKKDNNYNYLISVDGGINNETAKACINSSVDMLVSGSYVCQSDNYQEQIDNLKAE